MGCDLMRPRFDARMNSSLELRRDYTFTINPPKLNLNVINPCLIGTPTGNVNLTDLVSGVAKGEILGELNSEFSTMSSEIENIFYDAIEDMWSFLNQPLTIDTTTVLWFNPKEILLKYPSYQASNTSLNTRVGITFRPELIVGNGLSSNSMNPLPLAKFISNVPNNRFNIYMPAYLHLPLIEEQITNRLTGALSRSLSIGGVNFTIDVSNVQFRAYGDYIVLKMDYQSSGLLGEGWIYFYGRPQYNIATKILSVPDLDYSAESGNMIDQLLGGSVRQLILNTVRQAVTIDLTSLENDLRADFQSALNNLTSGNMVISGNVQTFQFTNIRTAVERNAIEVVLEAQGNMNISLGSLTMETEERKIKTIRVYCDIFQEDKESPCAFTLYLEKDGHRCRLVNAWGAGPTWADFGQFAIASNCFKDQDMVGNYELDIQVVSSDARSPCRNLAVEAEFYFLIEDYNGNTYLSPMKYKNWLNARSGSVESMSGIVVN